MFSGGLFGFIGVMLAVYLSWTKWHSVLWAIINGFFGWFYVIYFFLVYFDPTKNNE